MEKHKCHPRMVSRHTKTKDNVQIFISFDVVNFYPSISHDLLSKALKFANAFTGITDEEKEIIFYAKQSLLFDNGKHWAKKTPVTRSMSGRARKTEQRPAS